MDDRFKHGRRRTLAVAAALVAAAAGARSGLAQENKPAAEPARGIAPSQIAFDPMLTLDPTLPQVGALPGGVTPAFGQKSLSEGEWRFDFHGFLTAPLNAGINSRRTPLPAPPAGCPAPCGQSSTVLHAPPVVPDDLETFSHTGVVPTTYVQLNFSEGNSIVTGNVSVVAKQANVSTSFLEPASQLGITDVFISILPPIGGPVRLQGEFGAFTLRYGATGEYDEGRYGTPLIARISGVGEHITARMPSGNWMFILEQGVHGQTNKAPSSVAPDVTNNFADPAQGSSFVAHVHGGVGLARRFLLGGHFLHSWSQDDRAGANAPDGRIDVAAADARLSMGRFGHLYAAYSHTDALQSRSVSRIISVLNTQGGLGLISNYFGDPSTANPGDPTAGTGTLNVVGGQYDLSVGKLVSYPVPFYGDGPDLFVSVFGIYTRVGSAYKGIDPMKLTPFDGITKVKFGAEATYSVLPWLAVSGRFDRVQPNVDDNDFSFSVATARMIFRTDWQATDQVVLQYSHWFNGSLATVRTGDPPMDNLAVVPDPDMVSLSASMWW